MEDLNIKLLEYNAPIDPNTYFTKNPMKHSFIIPFENLKIEKRVSEGASGVVFRAIWKTTRTQVAIKVSLQHCFYLDSHHKTVNEN